MTSIGRFCVGCLTLTGETVQTAGGFPVIVLFLSEFYLAGVVTLCASVIHQNLLALMLLIPSVLLIVGLPTVWVGYYCARTCAEPGFVVPCKRGVEESDTSLLSDVE